MDDKYTSLQGLNGEKYILCFFKNFRVPHNNRKVCVMWVELGGGLNVPLQWYYRARYVSLLLLEKFNFEGHNTKAKSTQNFMYIYCSCRRTMHDVNCGPQTIFVSSELNDSSFFFPLSLSEEINHR